MQSTKRQKYVPWIKSWRDIWLYMIGIAIVAVLATITLTNLWFGDELSRRDRLGAIIIAFAISIPLGLYGGWQILTINRLSLALEEIVRRDRLSKAATRDYFFNQLSEQPERMGVVMMVDIDEFKTVNDTYGHMTGDEVVARTGEILKQETRASDIVCRFGGDEFVVFLDGVTEEQAHVLAERVRQSVEESVVKAADDDRQVSVTVSIGLSEPLTARVIERAIQDADAALYRAKEAGRNAVARAA